MSNTETMFAPIRSNVSDFINAVDQAGASLAQLAVSLIPVLDFPLVVLREGERPFTFTMRDYAVGFFKNDKDKGIIEDRTLTSLASNAMLVEVFAADLERTDILPKIKTARDKTLSAAIAIADVLGGVYDRRSNPGGVRLVERKGKVFFSNLRLGDFAALTNDKGQPTNTALQLREYLENKSLEETGEALEGEALDAAMAEFRFTATGGFGLLGKSVKLPSNTDVLTRLRAMAVEHGLAKAPAQRNRESNEAMDANKWGKQLGTVQSWVLSLSGVDGETDIAPTAEHEAAMDAICEAWAAYRVAHPAVGKDADF